MKERIAENRWLLFILLLALGVRVWGLSFGLPMTECRPDENLIVKTASGFFSGDLNPHNFHYPTFFMYLMAGFYGLAGLLAHALGKLPVFNLVHEAARNPAPFFLAARLVSALFGTAAVYWLYLLGKRLFDRRTGLLAALFLSLAYLHVRDSHFGVTDVAMASLVLLSLAVLARAWREDRLALYLMAGLCAGLAAGTKYNAFLLLLPMLAIRLLQLADSERREAFALNPRLRGALFWGMLFAGLVVIAGAVLLTPAYIETHLATLNNWKYLAAGRWLAAGAGTAALAAGLAFLSVPRWARFWDWRLLGFAGMMAAAFLASTPFALIDVKRFAGDLLYEVVHLQAGHNQIDLGIGWWYHLRHTLPAGLGWPLLLAGLVGLGLMIFRREKAGLILLVFPLAYYLAIGKGRTVFLRYMIPIVPFVCLTAAYFVGSGWRYVSRRRPELSWLAPGLAGAAMGLLLLKPAWDVFQFDRLLAKTDSRLIAADWFQKNIPTGYSLHQTGYWACHLVVNPIEGPDWMQVRTPEAGRGYRLLDYDPAWKTFVSNGQPVSELPDVLVWHEYPLYAMNPLGPELRALLRDRYRLKQSFVAWRPEGRHFFDQLDAFYLPYQGWDGVDRPGPNVHIYVRQSPREP